MRAISARLAQSDYDIIGLQELWVSSVDYEAFKKALASRFPYSKFFYGSVFDGLLTCLGLMRPTLAAELLEWAWPSSAAFRS